MDARRGAPSGSGWLAMAAWAALALVTGCDDGGADGAIRAIDAIAGPEVALDGAIADVGLDASPVVDADASEDGSEDALEDAADADGGSPGPDRWCWPCASNDACLPEQTGLECVSLSPELGAFCLEPCPHDVCEAHEVECACTDEAIAAGAATPCAQGACQGQRVCGPEGLTGCSAPAPAAEACNGQDDDCDGETDEGFGDLDGDGVADCVDPDRDGDGVLDGDDLCPDVADPDQSDLDGDGVGDACDPPNAPVLSATDPASPGVSLTPWVLGTADPHHELQLFAGACEGTPTAEAVAAASGAFSVAAQVAPDAQSTLRARARNAAGLLSPCSAPLTYVHDGLAPAAPVLSHTAPPSPSRATATPVVHGLAEPAAQVELYADPACDGLPLGVGPAGPTGAFAVAAKLPANAATALHALARDAAGNASPCAPGPTFVHDDLAPPPPTLTGTQPASPGTALAPQVTGAAEPLATVWIFDDPACDGAIVGQGKAVPSGAFSIQAIGAYQGAVTFGARAVDAAGNVSDCSPKPVPYVHDTVPPAAPAIVAVTPNGWVSGPPQAQLFGTAEPNVAVTVHATADCSGVPVGGGPSGPFGNFFLYADFPPNTVSPVAVRAVDGAGNASPCADTGFVFAHDDQPPAFAGLATVHAPTPSAARLGWAAATDALTPQDALVYEVCVTKTDPKLGGCAVFQAHATTAPGATELVVGDLAQDEDYWFVVRARDLAGNRDGNQVARHLHTPVPGAMAQLTGGERHGCARGADGRVRCWGWNVFGQLGHEGAPGGLVPELAGVLEVAAGARHTCALVGQGRVRCWGENGHLQLGAGDAPWRLDHQEVLGLSGATAVTAGVAHTCARLGDGTARCWGRNDVGQLGGGGTGGASGPVQVTGLTDARALAAGTHHSCALRGDGRVVCWGANVYGQVGVTTGAGWSPPVLVPDVVQATTVAAGDGHTCVTRADGTVACWGRNDVGQLGVAGGGSVEAVTVPGVAGAVAVVAGRKHTCALSGQGAVSCWGAAQTGGAAPALGGPVTALAAGAWHTCARRADGAVTCWGDDADGQASPGPLASEPGATALGLGFSHSCAVRGDGTVRCWGWNGDGQLGDGATSDRRAAVAVAGVAGAVEVAGGSYHTCARLASGQVTCWGRNDEGQLGRAAAGEALPPAAVVGLTDATGLAAGGSHTCARRASGQIACWGWNLAGQLGPAGGAGGPDPVVVAGVPAAREVAVGTAHSCALGGDGRVHCWGANDQGQLGNGGGPNSAEPAEVQGLSEVAGLRAAGSWTCATRVDGGLWCWGKGPGGTFAVPTQVAVGGPVIEAAPGFKHALARLGGGAVRAWGAGASWPPAPGAVGGLPAAARVASGGGHGCGLLADGGVRCVGLNDRGQLGDGGAVGYPVPQPVVGLPAASGVSAGGLHTCAVAGGGVWCWGHGAQGQLGTSNQSDRLTPGAVVGLAGGAGWQVAAGSRHTCAVDGDGDAWCWGAGGAGQLGNGQLLGATSPKPVTNLEGLVGVAAGQGFEQAHTCAVRHEGTAWCWGAGADGRLGQGTLQGSAWPVEVTALTGVAQVVTGFAHSCARQGSGRVTCWGTGKEGQLGHGAFGASSVPVEVSGVDDAVALAAGFSFTCAVRQGGEVACWGRNAAGQLGDGTTSGSTMAVAVVGLDDAVAVTAGASHACALRQGGEVACWGDGWAGQLGQGALVGAATPTPVAGLGDVVAIDAGDAHTCALRQGGAVVCWGYDGFGQLGAGGVGAQSDVAVPVAAFP